MIGTVVMLNFCHADVRSSNRLLQVHCAPSKNTSSPFCNSRSGVALLCTPVSLRFPRTTSSRKVVMMNEQELPRQSAQCTSDTRTSDVADQGPFFSYFYVYLASQASEGLLVYQELWNGQGLCIKELTRLSCELSRTW